MKVVSARSTVTAMRSPSRQARLATWQVSRSSSPAKRTTRHEPFVEDATVNPTSSGSTTGEGRRPDGSSVSMLSSLGRRGRNQGTEQRKLRAKPRPCRHRTRVQGPQTAPVTLAATESGATTSSTSSTGSIGGRAGPSTPRSPRSRNSDSRSATDLASMPRGSPSRSSSLISPTPSGVHGLAVAAGSRRVRLHAPHRRRPALGGRSTASSTHQAAGAERLAAAAVMARVVTDAMLAMQFGRRIRRVGTGTRRGSRPTRRPCTKRQATFRSDSAPPSTRSACAQAS
jgi:hypothetical protein